MRPIPLHAECKACGTIVEAPLMVDSKSCCIATVKTLCLDYLKEVFAQKRGRVPTPEEMAPYIIAIDLFIGEKDG